MGFAGDIREALKIGLASARANAVPMVVLWTVAAGVAVGYYRIPGVAAVLEPLRVWQGEHELVGAFVSRVFFCGLVPGVFLLTVKAIRPKRPWATMVAQALWCGGWGVFYVFLYRLMSEWFGDGPEPITLVKKTAFDMFVWSALVMVPLNFWALVFLCMGARRNGLRGSRSSSS